MAALPRLVNGVYFNFIDTMGGQSQTLYTAEDQSDSGLGPYGGLATAIQNMTCAGLFCVNVQQRGSIVVTPSVADYPTVQDQAVIMVRSSNYTRQFCIPAPLASIFNSDLVTVNLASSLVEAWFSELQAVCGDSYGNPWVSMLYGYRRKIQLVGS